VEWLDGDTDDTFKDLDQLRKKRQPVLPPVREKGEKEKNRSRVGRDVAGVAGVRGRRGAGACDTGVRGRVPGGKGQSQPECQAEVWPEQGDKVEMKKNLGAIGWGSGVTGRAYYIM
jgi:hypothetical protein